MKKKQTKSKEVEVLEYVTKSLNKDKTGYYKITLSRGYYHLLMKIIKFYNDDFVGIYVKKRNGDPKAVFIYKNDDDVRTERYLHTMLVELKPDEQVRFKSDSLTFTEDNIVVIKKTENFYR